MKRLWKSGEPFIWFTGGALALALLMVAGLIGLILVNGLGFFWPQPLVKVTLKDGSIFLGQVVDREPIPRPGTPERPSPRTYLALVLCALELLLCNDF